MIRLRIWLLRLFKLWTLSFCYTLLDKKHLVSAYLLKACFYIVYHSSVSDKLLSEVTQVRLKFGDMAGFMDKQACDDVFWFLFENDCRYTGIDKPIDLFDVLIQRLPDITVANFFEILRITKKEGVARRFHADLHQVTCEDNKDR